MTDDRDSAQSGREAAQRALVERRRQLVAQVARVEDDLRWFESNHEPEQLEEGQEQALAGILERLDQHDRDEISAIDRALARIARGEYGICRGCGAEIPAARQRVQPAADLCRPCAERRETR
jgi:RNA polymerase-binding transcription factor DksA